MCNGQVARGVWEIGGPLLASPCHVMARTSATPEPAGFSGPRLEHISLTSLHDVEQAEAPGANTNDDFSRAWCTGLSTTDRETTHAKLC
ncbi:MAG: hypothetical protein ACKVP2_04375 [Burkholderiales bacterium]